MNIQIQDSSKIQGYLLNRVMIYDILYISKNDSEFHYWRIEDRIRIRSEGRIRIRRPMVGPPRVLKSTKEVLTMFLPRSLVGNAAAVGGIGSLAH